MSKKVYIFLLVFLSALLLSIPFLVPGTGFISLVAFIPLLFAEQAATETGMKGFCWWHYLCFLLWNAATTFWVCNATVPGLRTLPLEPQVAQGSLALSPPGLCLDSVGKVVPDERPDQLAVAGARQFICPHDVVDPMV